jgi:hypothetical protein
VYRQCINTLVVCLLETRVAVYRQCINTLVCSREML